MARSKFAGDEKMSEDNIENQESIPVKLILERIFLKDASFESPSSPSIFESVWKPDLKVDINTKASSLSENRHEVVLRITIDATTEGDKPGFIVEIQQAGIFLIEGVFGDELRKVLGVACPTTLFPYLRESVDSLIVKGGFPAINLAPIYFEMVFDEAVKQCQQRESVTH